MIRAENRSRYNGHLTAVKVIIVKIEQRESLVLVNLSQANTTIDAHMLKN